MLSVPSGALLRLRGGRDIAALLRLVWGWLVLHGCWCSGFSQLHVSSVDVWCCVFVAIVVATMVVVGGAS
eukprot:7357170-Alexandrium_andersonii.AAC.1